jgi:hypothetical protein
LEGGGDMDMRNVTEHQYGNLEGRDYLVEYETIILKRYQIMWTGFI